jgi:methylase of polypeptide subunit release factors
MMPLRIGSEESFRAVREFFDGCGYTEEAAAARIAIPRLADLSEFHLCDRAQRERNLRLRDALGVVVKLFLLGHALDATEAREFIPPPVFDAMLELDLLEPKQGAAVSPVMLYPAHTLYLASDRYWNPDGSEPKERSDLVYLVLHRSADDFIRITPDTPCATFFDLGAGCGVAALWAAKNFAQHAWASDITERASHFAEFNRRLNGIANATVVQGDMYGPIGDLRFDRITTHPPYEMSNRQARIYADGGEDGETLLRRAISEAPAHLLPGGVFTCQALMSDRAGEPAEQRVRQWLGEAGRDCDVAVLPEETIEPLEYAVQRIRSGKSFWQDVDHWRALFARYRIEQLIYGCFVVRRHGEPGRNPFTVRRMRSKRTSRAAVDWMLAWESAAAQPESAAMLFESRPAAASGAELVVRHQMEEGDLRPVEYTLKAAYPFEASFSCPAALAFLFSRCNGSRTGAELYAELAPKLPAAHGQDLFLRGLASLVSGGFVEIEAFRLPAAE